jgi:hypothetical protein
MIESIQPFKQVQVGVLSADEEYGRRNKYLYISIEWGLLRPPQQPTPGELFPLFLQRCPPNPQIRARLSQNHLLVRKLASLTIRAEVHAPERLAPFSAKFFSGGVQAGLQLVRAVGELALVSVGTAAALRKVVAELGLVLGSGRWVVQPVNIIF